MSNSSKLNGLPGWIRVVAVVGFPVLVALYLLGAVTGAFPTYFSQEHIRIEVKPKHASSS